MTATLTNTSARSANSLDQLDSALFTAESPVGFAGGDTNLTRYVGNNTPNLTDPFGLQAQGPEPVAKPPTSATLDLEKHYPVKPIGHEGMDKGAMTVWDFVPGTYLKEGGTVPIAGVTTLKFTTPKYSTKAVFDEMESFYIVGTNLKDPVLIAHETMHLKMAEQSAALFTAYVQKKVFLVPAEGATAEKLKELANKEVKAIETKFYDWSKSFQNITYHAFVLDPKTKLIDPKKQAEWEKQYEKILKQAFEKAFPLK